ncbi:hypothetical protein ATCC90586_002665 [Pythium insidiosum]|nr:hypothetical protein ATCC90586_002665 [Pythium insidiosum]
MDAFKDFDWQVFKSEDYDEEGWLYSTEFGDDWGPMTRASAVRTRVWMGKKHSLSEKADADHEQADSPAEVLEKDTKELDASDVKLESSDEKLSDDAAEKGEKVEMKAEDEKVLFPTVAEPKCDSKQQADDKVLFPAPEGKDGIKTPPTSKTGFFGKMAVVSADFLRKYGRAGLLGFILRNEFMQSFATLKGLIGDLDDLGFQDAAIASEDIEAFKERAKTLWAPRKREWAREVADMRKGKLGSNATSPVKAESKQTYEAKEGSDVDEKEKVSSWTLTRTNLIEQLDKTVADEDSNLVSPEAREAEEKVERELKKTLMHDPKELYIPGRVTHIYFYKGVYEAVHVDRKCEALARIPVFQNMLSDHLGRNYLNALRVVRDARRASPTLPEWVPFGTKTRCMCCDSPFTWNSTSSSEAQQNRDQHNCRKCGWLVCDGCSEKWKSIPEFGINYPVRVCDRCTFMPAVSAFVLVVICLAVLVLIGAVAYGAWAWRQYRCAMDAALRRRHVRDEQRSARPDHMDDYWGRDIPHAREVSRSKHADFAMPEVIITT